MMKNVDVVSRFIDPLTHKFLVTGFNVRTNNIRLRPFNYNFDVSSHCSNFRHIYDTDLLPEHTTVSTVPTPLVLYHSAVCFSLSISSINHASVPFSLPSIVISPGHITLLSFDSIIYSFDS